MPNNNSSGCCVYPFDGGQPLESLVLDFLDKPNCAYLQDNQDAHSSIAALSQAAVELRSEFFASWELITTFALPGIGGLGLFAALVLNSLAGANRFAWLVLSAALATSFSLMTASSACFTLVRVWELLSNYGLFWNTQTNPEPEHIYFERGNTLKTFLVVALILHGIFVFAVSFTMLLAHGGLKGTE
jgi:hypothetical protein